MAPEDGSKAISHSVVFASKFLPVAVLSNVVRKYAKTNQNDTTQQKGITMDYNYIYLINYVTPLATCQTLLVRK